MTEPTSQLNTLIHKLKTLQSKQGDRIFENTDTEFKPSEQVSLNLILLKGRKERLEDVHRKIFNVAETIDYLQHQHPNTKLSDLKSLTTWYNQLIKFPKAYVNKPDTKHHEVLMTVNQVVDQVLNFLNDVDQNKNNDDDSYQVINYVLSKPLNTLVTDDWYSTLGYAIMYTPYDNSFYKTFSDSQKLIAELQDEIHDTATANDTYYNDDDDDFNNFGTDLEFEGYNDDDIQALKETIKNYETFVNQPHNYMYKDNQIATIKDVIDFFIQKS